MYNDENHAQLYANGFVLLKHIYQKKVEKIKLE